jgi:hypothetical protein
LGDHQEQEEGEYYLLGEEGLAYEVPQPVIHQ